MKIGEICSPQVVTIAPANALALSPASQTGGARPTQTVTYTVQLQNLGFNTDKYNLTVSGNTFPTTFWNASFTPKWRSRPPRIASEASARSSCPRSASLGGGTSWSAKPSAAPATATWEITCHA